MDNPIVSRAPRLRCHDCGTAVQVDLLCHHCGKALCAEHAMVSTSAVGPQPGQTSQEFAGMDLDGVDFVHCQDCHHVVRPRVSRTVYGAGIGGAVLGVLVLALGAVPFGVILLLAGLGVGAYAYYEDGRRKQAMLAARPLLPLVPGVEHIEIVEHLHGTLLLDENGDYRTGTDEATGHIAVRSAFGRPDLERLDAYRDRFGLSRDADIEFHAGFLALRGTAGIEMQSDPADPTSVPMRGRIAEQPYLATDSGLSNGQWRIELPYSLAEQSRPRGLPLWLTPSLSPEQDQRSLELELQWAPIATPAGYFQPKVDSVERLRLLVPTAWGNVEKTSWASSDDIVRVVSIGTEADDAGETWRVVEWTKSRVTPQEARDCRLTVSVRFEHQVNLKETVRGSLEVLMRDTFSGLTGVEVIHPLGGPRRNVRGAEITTRVEADFQLSLNHVRYQDVRKVPDHKGTEDADRRGREKDRFTGVIPDHETIIKLTNAISEDKYYVKRVIENPPRFTGTGGNSVNRAWDIAGRRYNKVYPVDFQITLTGEEIHRGGIRAADGYTSVALTVNGTYANETMRAQIGAEWDRLHSRIVAALEDIQAEAAVLPSQRDAEPMDEVPQQAPEPRQQPRPAAPPRDSAQLDLLFDLLAKNQISKEQFQELYDGLGKRSDQA